MRNVLIFAGTTEGRLFADKLAAEGVLHTVCVATDYGVQLLKEHPCRTVHQGRMNAEEIKEFIRLGSYQEVVDATHPYAELITKNIHQAVKEFNETADKKISYVRIKRDSENGAETELEESGMRSRIRHFSSAAACALALEQTTGAILLTTGSKELAEYCASEQVQKRLFVRILPSAESLLLCEEQGICGKQVIAMQGPFTMEMNAATIRQYQILHLVTKESGARGGYLEKLEAAKQTGCDIYVIDRPKEAEA